MGRRAKVFVPIISLLLMLSILSLPPSCSAQEVVVELIEWKVSVRSLYTISTGGDPSSFDIFLALVDAEGTRLKVDILASEIAGFSGKREGGSDEDAIFSVTVMVTTEITIECNVRAKFKASAEGRGTAFSKFDDGLDAIFFASAGTGFAKVAGMVACEGDLSYPRDSPQLRACTGAIAVGDVESELTGQVALKGIGVSYTPKVGEGSKSMSFAGNDMKTLTGNKFTLKFSSYAKVDVKGDDSGVGSANIDALVETTQASYIKAIAETEGLKSTLEFKLVNGTAEYHIVVTDTTGEVLQKIDKSLEAPTAHWKNYDGKVEEDKGWGLPAREWKDPPRGLKLGISVGDWAEYRILSGLRGLGNISTLRYQVMSVDENTGWILLALLTRYLNGRSEVNLVKCNIYTGEGEVRGLIIPSMLDVGDELYGIGKVTKITSQDMGGRSREVVYVTYSEGAVKGNATYDRATGILLGFHLASPNGTLAIEAIDSVIHHPSIEELQNEISRLNSTLSEANAIISKLELKLKEADAQVQKLKAQLAAETEKRAKYEEEVKALRSYVKGIEDELRMLKWIALPGLVLAIFFIVILGFLYFRRREAETIPKTEGTRRE